MQQIPIVKLDGSTYLEWSWSAKMFNGGKGKLGYMNANLIELVMSNSSHEKWET